MEYAGGAGIEGKTQGGDAWYKINGEPAFYIKAEGSPRTFRIQFVGISAPNHPQNSFMDIGFGHNGQNVFVLAGNAESGYISNSPNIDWMQSNLNMLGNRSLRHICMPYSHDAGMSAPSHYQPPDIVNAMNTQTQTFPIAQQLNLGIRAFDIRPVIYKGQFWTGHYTILNKSDVEPHIWELALVSPALAAAAENFKYPIALGGNGQSLEEVMEDVNTFQAKYNELVILEFSHGYNIDKGGASFTEQDWKDVAAALSAQNTGLKNLYSAPSDTKDLTTIPLRDMINPGQPKAATLAIITNSTYTNQDAANFPTVFDNSLWDIAGSYKDTDSVETMTNDQKWKLAAARTNPDTPPFYMVWTLTQQAAEAIFAPVTKKTIRDLADEARPSLFLDIFAACTKQTYPNFLEHDNCNDSNVAALALAINYFFAAD